MSQTELEQLIGSLVRAISELAKAQAQIAKAQDTLHGDVRRLIDECYRRIERLADSVFELAHKVEVAPMAIGDRLSEELRRAGLPEMRSFLERADARAAMITPPYGTPRIEFPSPLWRAVITSAAAKATGAVIGGGLLAEFVRFLLSR